MEDFSRRQKRRIPCHIPARVYIKEHFSEKDGSAAEILNISEGGAFVHGSIPLLIGDEVLVEILFSGATVLEARVTELKPVLKTEIPESSKERSVVRWVRGSSQAGFGVEFVNLGQDKIAFLNQLLDYLDSLNKG